MLGKKTTGESIENITLIINVVVYEAANYQRKGNEICWKIYAKPTNWKTSRQGE